MTEENPEVAVPPGGGLSWSWDLDLDAVLASLSGRAPGCAASPAAAGADLAASGLSEDDQAEAEFAEYLEAVDAGRCTVVPLTAAAGLIAESLPASPALAGWVADSPAAAADDQALTGLASSCRRLAAWAQARELTAVAQLASRSAAADDKIGVLEDGRPAQLPHDACGQVSLALTMSQASASGWTDLAVTLQWRLPRTGAALRTGLIDLPRARAIADATTVLGEDAAQAVESRILPKAGDQTLGQLRAALRRAVIAADPRGAEKRREQAEQRARIALYPDAEGTANLAGYNLPGVLAAAAMARITALAMAVKASGASGGIDLLRSKVFTGLLLGTLPHIPPPPHSPPDNPPDDNDGPPDDSCPPDNDGVPDDSGPPGDSGCAPGDAGMSCGGASEAERRRAAGAVARGSRVRAARAGRDGAPAPSRRRVPRAEGAMVRADRRRHRTRLPEPARRHHPGPGKLPRPGRSPRPRRGLAGHRDRNRRACPGRRRSPAATRTGRTRTTRPARRPPGHRPPGHRPLRPGQASDRHDHPRRLAAPQETGADPAAGPCQPGSPRYWPQRTPPPTKPRKRQQPTRRQQDAPTPRPPPPTSRRPACGNTSPHATSPAASPPAGNPPHDATWTTPNPTTRAAKPAPATSAPYAATTTSSNSTPAGNSPSQHPAPSPGPPRPAAPTPPHPTHTPPEPA